MTSVLKSIFVPQKVEYQDPQTFFFSSASFPILCWFMTRINLNYSRKKCYILKNPFIDYGMSVYQRAKSEHGYSEDIWKAGNMKHTQPFGDVPRVFRVDTNMAKPL